MDTSDEYRNSLSMIQMRLQILARKYQDDLILKSTLDQIQNDVTGGTKTLENLLLLTRLDPQNHQQLPLTKMDISQLILNAIQMVGPQAELKNIQWQVQLETVFTHVNSALMLNCITNLLDNAIRYHQQNGKITICCTEIQSVLNIVIEDDGMQLSDETLK